MYYSFCMYIPFYTFFLIVIFKSFNLFSVNSTNIQFNSFYTFKTFSPFSLYIPYVYLYTFLPYISFYLLSPNLTFYIFYPFKIYRIYLTDIQYISKKQNKKNKLKLSYENRRMIFYGKYILRICPFTGKESLLPSKSCNTNVDGPMTSKI